MWSNCKNILSSYCLKFSQTKINSEKGGAGEYRYTTALGAQKVVVKAIWQDKIEGNLLGIKY